MDPRAKQGQGKVQGFTGAERVGLTLTEGLDGGVEPWGVWNQTKWSILSWECTSEAGVQGGRGEKRPNPVVPGEPWEGAWVISPI